ncbi:MULTISPECIES: 4-hydroxythreonine-4-phosphate dehydrogenase PdxA [unclassified Paenibacillus]|uniref:PdxA family dehydrogenase n=1 Tax=unclassified Paenibacillus TaxID=185978 RepID=UPI001AE8333F|nr:MULTISPECIES: 4-hydroxythreonine-4-phosphate dehydrogenase PdxA [unclassified Paenibacillus]MBP1155593.1 4-hydroxythreonine-4-phosphate dehydrogenase [Paenibacillus sp. PvP091]MBP1169021.1 4-hydroxythreonine-4-phosphate dehydrogenase [Paenibacillus sp. PvR098]MBP2440049.1 4-hydroxythreonine-4-phosphate dehydrogenase [Paenibacillus sp. PvP052]
MKNHKPIIVVTIGDPAGIGPEIALKALWNQNTYERCHPILVGDKNLLEWYVNLLRAPLTIHPITKPDEALFKYGIVDVIHIPNVQMDQLQIGEFASEYGKAMLDYTNKALQLAMDGQVHAVIGGPHTKKSVELAGVEFDGYPGYVAKVTGTQPEEAFLMLVSDQLRIVNVTLHVSLCKALQMINKALVLKAIRATDKAVRNMGVHNPRIAVAGVNPHAGEQGMFGTEEIEEIEPAIIQARQEGIHVFGPYGSDTLFLEHRDLKYDAYVAMYHDQAHMPIKLLAFDKITAFTTGTPVFFCTVGHGSAPNIAGKGAASPNSLLESIRLLSHIPVSL